MTDLDTLYAIQSRDPDGGEFKPTDEDYRLFREWVTKTYGAQAWRNYIKGSWGPEPEGYGY